MMSNRSSMAKGTICLLVLLVIVNLQNNKDGRRLDSKSTSSAEQILQHLILYGQDQRMQLARDLKLAYVHVPKTGGSTIEDSSLFDHKRKHGIAPRSHHSVRRLKSASETDGFLVATHIRDPCERFMSAFLYLRYDPRSQGMRKDAEDFGLFDVNTTEQFVDFLDGTNQWKDLQEGIFHFLPMVHWMVDEDQETFGVDVVMCQDDWEEGIRKLATQLGISKVPSNLLHQKRVNKAHDMSCEDMDRRYSKRIMDEYALDACLFGYDRYGEGEFQIEGRNTSQCIGAQFNRTWFSSRLAFCKNALSQTMINLRG